MANTWVNATKVTRGALGALEREVVLPQLVWLNGIGDFAGAANDTITLAIPAYIEARTRTLRGGTPLTADEQAERSVDVKLDTDVYKIENITDEDMELSIEDFNTQLTAPVLRSIVRGLEDEISDEITGATYTHQVTVSESDVYDGVLDARDKLNKSHLPGTQRTLLVGSDIEKLILKDLKGSGVSSLAESAINEATIAMNYAGFRVVRSVQIDPTKAYAFHRSAFVSVLRAPKVPQGAVWGQSATYNGLALRIMRDYDALYARDRFLGNVWVGNATVLDDGEVDEDGVFTPYETQDEIDSGTPILVRAVECTLGS